MLSLEVVQPPGNLCHHTPSASWVGGIDHPLSQFCLDVGIWVKGLDGWDNVLLIERDFVPEVVPFLE